MAIARIDITDEAILMALSIFVKFVQCLICKAQVAKEIWSHRLVGIGVEREVRILHCKLLRQYSSAKTYCSQLHDVGIGELASGSNRIESYLADFDGDVVK